ncbi:hypothetical protein JXL21_04425 [Candidatus Bathyarchaeota archaeon]|nr:hypothetical protein [Candidatus Bathyarchaeota archaeon]
MAEKLEAMLGLCAKLSTGAAEMAAGVEEMNASFNQLSMLVRPFAKRDFNQSMGLTAEEWAEFLARLKARLDKVHEAGAALRDGGDSMDELREQAKPFVERTELVEKKVRQFQRYTAESPKKMMMAPPGMVSEDMKAKAAEAPRQAEMVGEFAEAITELKQVLIDLLD